MLRLVNPLSNVIQGLSGPILVRLDIKIPIIMFFSTNSSMLDFLSLINFSIGMLILWYLILKYSSVSLFLAFLIADFLKMRSLDLLFLSSSRAFWALAVQNYNIILLSLNLSRNSLFWYKKCRTWMTYSLYWTYSINIIYSFLMTNNLFKYKTFTYMIFTYNRNSKFLQLSQIIIFSFKDVIFIPEIFLMD